MDARPAALIDETRAPDDTDEFRARSTLVNRSPSPSPEALPIAISTPIEIELWSSSPRE